MALVGITKSVIIGVEIKQLSLVADSDPNALTVSH